MYRKISLFFLCIFTYLCTAQNLNQYKYVIQENPNLALCNWDKFRDFVFELHAKGMIYSKQITPDMPRDQIVVCNIKDWHNGIVGRCTVQFYDLQFKTVLELRGTSGAGFGADGDISLAWKSVIKKLHNYKYKFTPIHHPELSGSNEIKIKKENGEYWIDCIVNDLPMKFILDTGATSVSLSKTEAKFMIKNGKLTEDDIIGTTLVGIADGSLAVGTKVNLRKIQIGKYVLKNIEAIISDSENAPLLLGQSALEMLGGIEIDFKNQIIKVK